METKSRKKVCYILPNYNKNTDTHFSYLYGLLESVKNNLDIFLIIEKSKGESELKVSNTVIINRNNKIVRILLTIFACFKARREGYKNFYIHYSFIGALSAIFVKTFMGGQVFYWNCGMPWLYRRKWIEESVFRFILRNTNLVTGTESIKENYINIYSLNPKNVFVMPNWIDIESFKSSLLDKKEAKKRLGIGEDKRVILFIHRLSKRKGADFIVPVAKKFKDEDFIFIVCGSGPEREALTAQVKSYKLQDSVILKGAVPHKEIPLYLSVADVFFMPSEEEGFPHVLLEAMVAGVPYVASNVAGVRDISSKEQQEFILDDRSTENFAAALRRLINSPLGPDILENHVKKYSEKNSKNIFIGLFR